MQEFLRTLYEALHGLQDTPLYRDRVYPQAGAAVLFCSFVSALTYYYLLGWVTARFVMTRHWVLALVANCVVSMLVVWAVGRAAFDRWSVPPEVVTLVLIQGLYAALLFAIFSLLMKWGSPNARRTPF